MVTSEIDPKLGVVEAMRDCSMCGAVFLSEVREGRRHHNKNEVHCVKMLPMMATKE